MSREIIGPALPPGFKTRERDPNEASQVSGPALPPGFVTYHSSSDNSDDEHALDDGLGPRPKRRKPEVVDDDDDEDDGFFGPALPPGFIKESDSPESPC